MFMCALYDKINMIVYMVWSVVLELRGGKFEPWLEKTDINIDFLFCIFVVLLGR